jgi:DNA-binding response OmpR family regulator
MGKIKLLFVEDDISFSFIIKGSLELTGQYEVQAALNGKEGLAIYKTFHPDVIVSDIEMPVMDGMGMVKQIRQQDEATPILFATGRTNAQDVLDGYALKVDNFIKKPFLPDELNAHIQAILKRIQNHPPVEPDGVLPIGKYLFNPDARTLQWGNETIKLTRRESLILWKLYQKQGDVLKRSELLEELWGHDDFFTSRSLDVFINTLRKYLSKDTAVRIDTVRGIGLKLVLL